MARRQQHRVPNGISSTLDAAAAAAAAMRCSAQMRHKSAKLFAVAFLVLAALIGVWYWAQCKSYESNAIAETSWQESGRPMVADVTASDQNGTPLGGVFVHVVNDSGGNGETTDSTGAATIRLGESEFSGLRLNHKTVVDRRHSGVLPYSPTVSNGLRIRVVVKDKAAIGAR